MIIEKIFPFWQCESRKISSSPLNVSCAKPVFARAEAPRNENNEHSQPWSSLFFLVFVSRASCSDHSFGRDSVYNCSPLSKPMVTGWEVYMQQRRSTLVTWSALYTIRHHHSISSSAFPSYHLHNFHDYRCLHNRGTLEVARNRTVNVPSRQRG